MGRGRGGGGRAGAAVGEGTTLRGEYSPGIPRAAFFDLGTDYENEMAAEAFDTGESVEEVSYNFPFPEWVSYSVDAGEIDPAEYDIDMGRLRANL